MSQATAHKCDDEQAEATLAWSHRRFCWNELLTHDPERAKDFYAKTIGWRFEPMVMKTPAPIGW
jgi:predicted enzyme related to lactoylglutathione lyase